MKEFLDHYKIDGERLAQLLGIQRVNLNAFLCFLDGDNPLDADLAWRLHRVLGPSPEYWMNLQQMHDLQKDKPKGLSKLRRLR